MIYLYSKTNTKKGEIMDKTDIIEFFDRLAPAWDTDMIRDDRTISIILDNAGIREGVEVLDVACGTGVLFPDYLSRNVKSITGIDISSKMVDIARTKRISNSMKVICADVEIYSFDHPFDCCMVYNAFPHFPEPARLIKVLAKSLKPGGKLSIAHGMSREKINRHHEGNASKVSTGLMDADELVKLFEPYFNVCIKISTDEMYQVCGVKKHLQGLNAV